MPARNEESWCKKNPLNILLYLCKADFRELLGDTRKALEFTESFNKFLANTKINLGDININLLALKECLRSISDLPKEGYLVMFVDYQRKKCLDLKNIPTREDIRLLYASKKLNSEVSSIDQALKLIDEKRRSLWDAMDQIESNIAILEERLTEKIELRDALLGIIEDLSIDLAMIEEELNDLEALNRMLKVNIPSIDGLFERRSLEEIEYLIIRDKDLIIITPAKKFAEIIIKTINFEELYNLMDIITTTERGS